jgi:LysR family transcriptional activator of nhaA
MNPGYSYRHLYYFWVVAHEGGMSRAAARLDVAVQTVSAQVRALERALGHTLLAPAGRGLALTDAGRAALRRADQIFELGQGLREALRDATATPSVRLAAGVADGLPKLVVHRLMAPVLRTPNLRLVCLVDEFDDLLAALALHRLDVVLADRPASGNANVRLYNHPIGESAVGWYAPRSLESAAKRTFPASLATVPVLLPTAHVAVRARLDQWFERHGVRANVVGEFEDSALLKTFGAGGLGVFPAAERVHEDLVARYDVRRIGHCDDVEERFFAIGTERKVAHPLVLRLLGRRGGTR